MRYLSTNTPGILSLCLLLAALPTRAQDAAAPAPAATPEAEKGAEEEAEEAEEAEPEAAEAAEELEAGATGEDVFKEGVSRFNAGDDRGAAEKLFDYLAGNEPSADFYEWSEYYLGRTFRRLGLTHAAAEYFYNVAKTRSRPELLPDTLRAVESIIRFEPHDEELLVYDLVAGSEFGDLPEDVAAFVEYYQGLVDLRDGQGEWADTHFKNTCPECMNRLERIERSSASLCETDVRRHECFKKTLKSRLDVETICEAALGPDADASELSRCYYFYRGRYAQGVESLRAGRDTAARRIFTEVAEAKLSNVDHIVVNDALKALARLYFEDGTRASSEDEVARANRQDLFMLALELYEQIQVPFLSHEEALIFLEKAWTRYYANDLRGAMGILVSLDAPSYRDYFKPERFILQALIYKQLCHYAAAKGAAREFRRRYGEALRAMRQKRDPLAHELVRRAALQGAVPYRRLMFLKSLQHERDLIEMFPAESAITEHLARLYDLKIKELVRELEVTLNEEAKRVADELLDHEEQARLVDYEVALEVFKRLKAGEGSTDMPDPEQPIPLGSRDVYYVFDGEYWNDELHDYRFRIDSRCFGEELVQ